MDEQQYQYVYNKIVELVTRDPTSTTRCTRPFNEDRMVIEAACEEIKKKYGVYMLRYVHGKYSGIEYQCASAK